VGEKKIERWCSFVWPFIVVGRHNGGSFLSMAVGGGEEMMLAGEVVRVVRCFAASAALLHLGFHQNIPNPL
jgi:hypothetical protein